jgi:hypothetical protein
MSVLAATTRASVAPATKGDGLHRALLYFSSLLAIAFTIAIAVYGFDYYMLDQAHRVLSPKHLLLKPSGTIGVRLGMLSTFLFFLIYLYPLRKRWGWLGKQGNSRHWLNFHVVLGTIAPVFTAFHSSFKFSNIAGMAFFSMLAVTVSGFVGRYLYSQIPRSLNAAELSMKELDEKKEALRKELAQQKLAFGKRMAALYDLPTQEDVASTPMLLALVWMVLIDLKRPLQVSMVRLQALGFGRWLLSFCGFWHSPDRKLEHAIGVARMQAALSKRILFLRRTQQVFRLWHVVHRPFSYAFAFLALLHIGIALFMGYGL